MRFRLPESMEIVDLEGIHECYEVRENGPAFIFTANISTENMRNFLERFAAQLCEPCFFILEVPANEKTEQALREHDTAPFHCDVYYWDLLSVSALARIIECHGELLIHDGLARFGFASHETRDELFIGNYNVARLFTRDRPHYERMFERLGIAQEDEIKCVYHNFTRDTPGTRSMIQVDGKNIYDMIEELKEQGLYFERTRAE